MAEPRFHHVGYVVASIEAGIGDFRLSVHAASRSEVFDDPIQRVRVAFLYPHAAGGLRVELVEPVGDDSPVLQFLRKGGGLHHVCFEVEDLDRQLAEARAARSILVRAPCPAVAFGGRRIAWVFTRQRLLVEYLEAAAPAAKPQ